MRLCVFFIIFDLVSFPAHATVLSGLAQIHLKTRRMDVILETVAVIDRQKATFVALDDFGFEILRVDFSPTGIDFAVSEHVHHQKSLKKVLKLPLSQSEFLSLFFGEPLQKYKKLKIVFTDFMMHRGESIPKGFVISYKKNFFEFWWVKLK